MAAVKSRSDKCPSCGKQHVPGFAFCQRCGAPLSPDLAYESAVVSPLAAADFNTADADDLGIEFDEIAPLAAKQPARRGRAGCAGALLLLAASALFTLDFCILHFAF